MMRKSVGKLFGREGVRRHIKSPGLMPPRAVMTGHLRLLALAMILFCIREGAHAFCWQRDASDGKTLQSLEDGKVHKKVSPGYIVDGMSKPHGGQAGIRIIDTFPYNGEMVVELRLEHLYKEVDEIIVVESRTTFSGKHKDLLFVDRDNEMFAPYADKVTFLIIDEVPAPDTTWLEGNTGRGLTDPSIWHREYYQRNIAAMKIQEKYQGSRYVVICSDADEIPNGEFVRELRNPAVYKEMHKAHHLAMNFSYYNFQWESLQEWHPAFVINDVGLSKHTFQDLRHQGSNIDDVSQVHANGGWHFSYYMSASEIALKLSSFSHSEYDTDQYRNEEHVRQCLLEGRDLFNRGPSYDMHIATAGRIAGYPEGWKEIAKKLAEMQKL